MADEIELLEKGENIARNGNSNPPRPGDSNLISEGKIVDFVMVYEETKGKDEEEIRDEEEKAEMRRNFEEHLIKEGLLLQHTDSDLNEEVNKVFVLIHAPWDVLTRFAEKMLLRFPLREASPPPAAQGFDKIPELISNWSKIFDPPSCGITKEKRFVHGLFSRDKKDSFLISDKDKFFSDLDRSRIVARILRLCRFSSEPDDFGIDRLLHRGVYGAAYPLHEGLSTSYPTDSSANHREYLQYSWASFRQWYRFQPLNEIKSYFGTRVGFYFAWLGTYNLMLVIAALVGLFCFIGGLASIESFVPAKEICDKANEKLFYMCPLCDVDCSYWSLHTSCRYSKITHLFDHEGTVFFAAFMALWSSLFLEVWKRQQTSLAFEWDMLDFDEELEPARPQFVEAVKERRPNPITGILEPFVPYAKQLIKQTCAFVVVLLMILLVIAAVVGVIVYRAAMSAALHSYPREDVRRGARVITSITASTINLVAITILSYVYNYIAVFLTNWENPRTRTQYTDALTFKMFLFQSVNMYSSLFYIAFFKSAMIVGVPGRYTRIGGGRLEGCDPSGCLIELCIQLAIILGGKQAISLIIKIVLPCLWRWWNRRSQRNLLETGELDRWELDYLLNPEPDFRMFYEYHDMVLQFGFVTMFVAAFPLAPLFALLNNILELRIDAINFVVTTRRPVAERARNIGSWLGILQTLSRFAILVNSFVIAFTSEFIPRLVYTVAYSPDGSLNGYVNNSLSSFNVRDFERQSLPQDPFQNLPYNNTYCRYKEYFESTSPYMYSRQFYYVLAARLAFVIIFQYLVIFTVFLINWLVPDVPYSLEIRMKHEKYIAQKMLHRERDEGGEGSQNSVYMSCENVARNRKPENKNSV
ncbi:anoctamin-4 isoform X2 [Nematostella vectensis]|nr:anoctamin-4 isoform X2 [Nematostella vectensis]XP_048576346.1 anoctamin-4 isoform X2 [Nematostella vectensis]